MNAPTHTQDEIRARLERLRRAPLSPECDPWDPFLTWGWAPEPLLTSIEVTVTNQCNLRCEHCAVGELLTPRDESRLPLDELIRALDAVESLVTFSLTGGEPAVSASVVREVVTPLLRYAKERGAKTQINTNLTLPLSRYLEFVEWVDVVHISYNYLDGRDFARIAYAHAESVPKDPYRLLERMEENVRALAARGAFVSAETILTEATLPVIDKIHRRVADLGCRRHEIHPLYPSDFAASMRLPTLSALRAGIGRLLDGRDPAVWLLFGTLPFFACSPSHEDRELVRRIAATPNTTIRNDPDGRNRLNISSMNGNVLLQDFADRGPLGNIADESLESIWRRWLASEEAARIHCACPSARCLGPNLIVAQTYYPEVEWRERKAIPA